MEYENEKLDDDTIDEISSDEHYIKLIRNQGLKLLSKILCKRLIKQLLEDKTKISVESLQMLPNNHNKYISRFDNNNNMREESVNALRNTLLKEYRRKKPYKMDDNFLEDDTYEITNTLDYTHFMNVIVAHSNVKFSYNENKYKDDDNKKIPLQKTIEEGLEIQRMFLEITTEGISFNFPLEYAFTCPECNAGISDTTNSSILLKKAHELSPTNNIIACTNYVVGSTRMKRCNTKIKPRVELSHYASYKFYQISYLDEEKKQQSALAITHLNLNPGMQECVFFNVPQNNKSSILHIVCTKESQPNIFPIPAIEPDKNYLFTLQESVDNFIEKQCNLRIWGLRAIKVGLILQKLFKESGERLIGNMQIIGDQGTCKTITARYYGSFLYDCFFKETVSSSVSIPGLRGSPTTITLFDKKYERQDKGLLGTMHCIVINEAQLNKVLVDNLKNFGLEDTYEYNRHGGNHVQYKRNAHLILTENIGTDFKSLYIGSIKKAYRERMPANGVEKVEWDDSWDLYDKLENYKNPYLRKAISDKRKELTRKGQWWIDGYDFSVHDRFPFYFYLAKGKITTEIEEAIIFNGANDDKRPVTNFDITQSLKNLEFTNWINEIQQYKDLDFKTPHNEEYMRQLMRMLKRYNYDDSDHRAFTFWTRIIKISAMSNKRNFFTLMDLDFAEWLMQQINIKIDTSETNHIEPKTIIFEGEKEFEEFANKLKNSTVFGIQNDFE